MRIIKYIYILTVIMFVWLFISKTYISWYLNNNWNGNCMLVYVKHLKLWNTTWWKMYNMDWVYHIEPLNSKNVLDSNYKHFEIWEVRWCDFSKIRDSKTVKFLNSVYCEFWKWLIWTYPTQYNEVWF